MKDLIKEIKICLKDFDVEQVEKFATYCYKLTTELAKDRTVKNLWATKINAGDFAKGFKRVHAEGLNFDGVHITFQSTGISYDYVAYKNKMLLKYPNSKIDVSVVYEGDEFSFSKENGSVKYKHAFNNVFKKEDKAEIIRAYCVIKNERGEFLTLLDKAEIEKHRKIAKTDYIWVAWYKEMVLKTIIKKACKLHFDDVYVKIEEMDNENYDLEKSVDVEINWIEEVNKISSLDELKDFYLSNKGKGKDFDKLVTERKKELLKK